MLSNKATDKVNGVVLESFSPALHACVSGRSRHFVTEVEIFALRFKLRFVKNLRAKFSAMLRVSLLLYPGQIYGLQSGDCPTSLICHAGLPRSLLFTQLAASI